MIKCGIQSLDTGVGLSAISKVTCVLILKTCIATFINSQSTMAQIIACCLTAPCHYLNQCWLGIIGIHPRTISEKITRHNFEINNHINLFADFCEGTMSLLISPSAAHMCQWTGPALVHVMACSLFRAKPLPEPMLAYCQLDAWEQISVKIESQFYHFNSRKCIWHFRLPKWWLFCPGGDELNNIWHKGVLSKPWHGIN